MFEDRVAAQGMGINVFKHQLTAFVLGGFAGDFRLVRTLAQHNRSQNKLTFGILLTFNKFWIMIVLGGWEANRSYNRRCAPLLSLAERQIPRGPMNILGFKIMGSSSQGCSSSSGYS